MALFIYAAALTTAHLLGNAIEILNRPNSAHAALQNGLHPFSLLANDNTTAGTSNPKTLHYVWVISSDMRKTRMNRVLLVRHSFIPLASAVL